MTQPSDEGWEDIGSAPMDGTEIELWACRPRGGEFFAVVGYYELGGWTEGWVDSARVNEIYATHWRAKRG